MQQVEGEGGQRDEWQHIGRMNLVRKAENQQEDPIARADNLLPHVKPGLNKLVFLNNATLHAKSNIFDSTA